MNTQQALATTQATIVTGFWYRTGTGEIYRVVERGTGTNVNFFTVENVRDASDTVVVPAGFLAGCELLPRVSLFATGERVTWDGTLVEVEADHGYAEVLVGEIDEDGETTGRTMHAPRAELAAI